MQISGFTDQTNDRFTNDDAFILKAFDLSGIGQGDGGLTPATGGQFATLISSNVIISANHFQPNGNIVFYPDNNPGSTPVVRSIANSLRVPNTDLWLAKLDTPVDNTITYFNFTREIIVGDPPSLDGSYNFKTDTQFQGLIGYTSGLSMTVHPVTSDQAFGRNVISAYSENIPFGDSQSDTLVLLLEQPGDPDYVLYESLVIGGDSGAPFFIEQNGALLLLGINSFQFQDTNMNPVASGISYIGNSAVFIDQFIAVSSVPEPATIVLLAVVGLLVCSRFACWTKLT